jgi:pimeloyl-ACP methyl ester carboxylesterase
MSSVTVWPMPAVRCMTTVDGSRISYQEAGPADGPVVVLIHGLLSDSETWSGTIGPLASRGLRVIAVDLVGHGISDAPHGPYLLDDFARFLNGFLDALNLDRVTVCGHSLGGAIAVHFGYHFPSRVDRLVLVSAGGLGKEVNLALRALSVRGAQALTGAVLGRRPVQWLLRRPWIYRVLRIGPDRMANFRRVGRSLMLRDRRHAFFASLRGVIQPSGQRGSFIEMKYLASHVPTLLIWCDRDAIIPVRHAHATHEHLPGSRLVVLPGRTHEPHRVHAECFADELRAFILS